MHLSADSVLAVTKQKNPKTKQPVVKCGAQCHFNSWAFLEQTLTKPLLMGF